MKKFACVIIFCTLFFIAANTAVAQCSICTKTASQLGEKAGNGLNTGIIYLMITPFLVGGVIGFKWWKQEKLLKSNREQND